jgi:hypothetical protein
MKKYYLYFDKFIKILHKHNPCKWKGNVCIANRTGFTADKVNGCCGTCDKNSRAGCTIQSLGCKQFLCEKAFYALPKKQQKKWRKITEKIRRYKIKCVKKEE